jgi:amidohydrolase
MTKRNSIADMTEEMTAWRRELHQNPGIAYQETYSAKFVEDKLKEWGISYKGGIAKTGIVATIEGQSNTSNKSIGLRGDMDALPVTEKSKVDGVMHACGHDGHTTILLAAAKYFNETKNFDGKVQLFFQPAEEGARGADTMIEEGVLDEFPVDAMYGLHNWPFLDIGKAELRSGPLLASSDRFVIELKGEGGHGAYPQNTKDSIVAGAAVVQALQTIVSRNIAPTEPVVISVCNFQAGMGADNVIPDSARISGTVRTFNEEVRCDIEKRIAHVCENIGKAYGVDIKMTEYNRCIDATINTPDESKFAADTLRDLLGAENVNDNCDLCMGGEDFGSFLYKVPGAYIFLGQGTSDQKSPHNQTLHSPFYDFNDDILPVAVDYFAELVERSMAVK